MREFVLEVLSDPEAMRERIEQQLERGREAFRDPQGRIRSAMEALSSLDTKRAKYQEMYVADAMTLPELKERLSRLDADRRTVQEDLAKLEDVSAELKRLEDLAEKIPEFLADLADLVEGTTIHVQEYDTVPPERTPENPLGLYTLTPERIRERTPEELEEIRRERERERAERFRWAYGELGLRVVVRRNGDLELSGIFGSTLRSHRESLPTRKSRRT